MCILGSGVPLCGLLGHSVAAAQISTDSLAREPLTPDPSTRTEHPASVDQKGAPQTPLEKTPPQEVPRPDWKEALMLYLFGQPDEALERLQRRALECGEPDEQKCARAEIVATYSAAGIVLAEAREDHAAAVRMFKRALALDPDVSLAPEYDTPRAARALRDARVGERVGGEEQATYNSSPASDSLSPPVSPSGDASPVVAAEDAPPARDKSHWFLFTGAGAEMAPFSTLFGDAAPTRLVASATFVAVPFDVGFALGVRPRFGVHLSGHDFGEASRPAFLGSSVVLGSVIGPRVESRFGFFLGGLGFEHVPEYDFTSGVANFQGGLALDGFSASGTASLAPTGVEYASDLYLGIEVGWGLSLFDAQ